MSLGAASRLFTAAQVSRHPELSWRSQPTRRARECLSNTNWLEQVPGPQGEPFRYRLSREFKRRHRINQRAVDGCSKQAEHWLGIADIWLEMTFSGGRPGEWVLDPGHNFDIICRWCNRLILIEYQRTPITTRQWEKKWETRKAWYKAQTWQERPTILLVDTTGQQESTVNAPRGTVVVKRIEDIHHALR